MVLSTFSGLTIIGARQEIAYASNGYELVDDIQDSAILHCWNWSYSTIEDHLELIAQCGYSAIQTSPAQQPKDYTWEGVVGMDVGFPSCGGTSNWWKLYQPVTFSVCDNGITWLGTKAELESLCAKAETYGIKVIVDVVANHMENITGWKNDLSDVSKLDSDIRAIRHDMADGQTVLKYYKDYEKNVTEKFNYKDEYGNLSYVTVNVQALDTEIPVVTSTTWFGIGAKAKPSELVDKVSNDVVAQIKCSKVVCHVNLYEYDENVADKKGTLISEDIPVKTEFTGKNVLVTYSDNLNRKIVVEMVASGNGRKAQKVLDAVNCIDKVRPDVTIINEEVAEDKLSKTFVFSTNEPTLFSENPYEGYVTEHILKVTKNKEVSCMFTDKAGNITEKNISITEIDTIPLKLSFSRNADGSNQVDTTEDMNLQVGETIYVKTNKAAQISVSDYIIDVEAEKWTAITFNIKTGLYILKATDRVTKKVAFENISIQNVDILAPIIDFDTVVVVIDETATVEEMNSALHSGVSISDNKDGNITEYKVSDIPKNVKHGYYTITYTAYDESGNEATAERMLYIAYKDEPEVKLNGKKVMPYGMTVVDNNSINIDVNGTSEKGLIIKCYSGICTTGQMKYCTAIVQNGESIKLNSKKYYTLYVRTKDKKEYVFYVYAE